MHNTSAASQVQFDRSPWPLFPFLAQTDKRLRLEAQIATSGCAFMLCCAVGHMFSRPSITAQYNEHQKPQDVLYLARCAKDDRDHPNGYVHRILAADDGLGHRRIWYCKILGSRAAAKSVHWRRLHHLSVLEKKPTEKSANILCGSIVHGYLI